MLALGSAALLLVGLLIAHRWQHPATRLPLARRLARRLRSAGLHVWACGEAVDAGYDRYRTVCDGRDTWT